MTGIEKWIDSHQEMFIGVAADIWEYAETGYKEIQSSARMVHVLKEFGFRVQEGVGGSNRICGRVWVGKTSDWSYGRI